MQIQTNLFLTNFLFNELFIEVSTVFHAPSEYGFENKNKVAKISQKCE